MHPSDSHATRSDEDEDYEDPVEASDSDIVTDGQEEPEYEEVEEQEAEEYGNGNVEKEEDVVEEVEVDREDELDLSNSPIQADKDPNDVSQDVKFEGHGEILKPGSPALEKYGVKISSDTLTVEESRGNFHFSRPSNEPSTTQKEESGLSYEKSKYIKSRKVLVPKERASKYQSAAHHESNGYLCNKDSIDAKTNFLSSITGNVMVDAILMKEHLGEEANGVMNTNEERKQLDLQSGHGKKRLESRFSRLASPDTRIRSLSPDAEIKDGNKRPAVICDFFAQGWCVRGSSCRFLHIKDALHNTAQKPEADASTLNWKKVQVDEGLRDIAERSRSPGFPEPQASSVGKCLEFSSQLSSERSRSPVFVSYKDVGRDGERHNWPADNYGDHASSNSRVSSIVTNGSLPDYRFSSSGSVLLSSNYRSGVFPSHSSSMAEMGSIWSQHIHSDLNSPHKIHSLNLSSNSSFLSTSMLLSHRISSWRASSSPFSHSSSLLRSSSPFYDSKSENLPITNVRLKSTEHKTKFSSNDWEPSVPFQPSFFIPPIGTPSQGRQYDPLLDSIELPRIGDQSFGVSVCGHGVSIMDASRLRKYDDSVLTGMLGPECNDETTSVSSHNKFHENVLEKDSRERVSLTTEAETVGTSAVDCQNGTMPKEENPLGPSRVKDMTKMSNEDHGSSHQNDVSMHQEDLKVSRARPDNEMDVRNKIDGNTHRESRAGRHFRAALIDLVKELLKPNWRDGHLNKDAHNMIVKKVVDKVLRALQSHQVPTTLESVKQYLSSSRPKIAKLVEGYVDKYGKS
ncbi:hypothetical protein I3760_09G062000 [Carya illinoinensis]|uniref:C3H1-type domain-containing protein n=1 Tax=Carya illinoinensis TaxID=32201 RepID=A0A922E234_CARIL|nr:protein FRIGIDA-ESSENTIAL 1 isoform X1 [Carya illinoinensis]KAG2687659.1 hypothetical protein I3760_09G062000 [Carya illinoinensis]KAG6694707.1 hypothetical protein I3842_09G062400 [Carya illinoinensis]